MVPSRRLLAVRCFFQPHRPCKYSEDISTDFEVVTMGNGHKAAAFLPAQLRLLRQPEPVRKALLLDCHLEQNVPEETPKASCVS